MAYRADRGNQGARRSSGGSSPRAYVASRATGWGNSEHAKARSHGSSRPSSPTHQGSPVRQSGRQVPRAQVRQANTRYRRRAQAGDALYDKDQAVPASRRARKGESPELASKSVRELRREARLERAKKSSRRYFAKVVAVVAVVVVLAVGAVALYASPAFSIENVEVNGVEHLTSDEMAQLANVPTDTTLLRVDVDTIASRVKRNAWVADVQVNRIFPDTLEIDVTERDVFAVVEVPTSLGASVKRWAIAADHVWLMPIPEAGSDAAKTTSSKIYEDAAAALRIVDVPYGTQAAIGEACVDANVNNALDVITGLTTELSGRIAQVSAAGTAETTLILDNGVEVAFGRAEDIRDKERVILQILEDNPDNVAYINVRMVETPTWRAV